jgi:hypothetical protein
MKKKTKRKTRFDYLNLVVNKVDLTNRSNLNYGEAPHEKYRCRLVVKIKDNEGHKLTSVQSIMLTHHGQVNFLPKQQYTFYVNFVDHVKDPAQNNQI